MLFTWCSAAAATFEPYPKPYASMGTPLYQSYDKLYHYHDLDGMPPLLKRYRSTLQEAYDEGIRLEHEKHLTQSDRMGYLATLRNVEASKKQLMHQLTLLHMQAIDNEDISTFNRLAILPLDELLPTFSTKDKTARFYLSHETVRTKPLNRLSQEMTALRKKRSKRPASSPYDVQQRRSYKLVTHLPHEDADDQTADANMTETCMIYQDTNGSTGFLEEVGRRCKALGINFDPSLMQKYRSHEMPSVKDFK
jgi:hypothetical protein